MNHGGAFTIKKIIIIFNVETEPLAELRIMNIIKMAATKSSGSNKTGQQVFFFMSQG